MDRHLSLSQAARLIGVKRTDIQKKIQENKLIVMEGTVVLSDLKKVFPEAHYEDNTMLEKMEKFMQEAVHKMTQSEREGAQLNSLSQRIVKVNNELAQERNRVEQMETFIDGMKQKFIELSLYNNPEKSFNEIKQWFNEHLNEQYNNELSTHSERLEYQIKQFMQPHIKLLPSQHHYISEPKESILESALRSGLAVNYGCNNGQCGQCKARLLSGEIEKTRHQDYVFSASEKNQNYILTCSNTAMSDLILETEEAVSVKDIPLQTIIAKVKKINQNNPDIIILTLKTPRSQRLRFLAGQHIEISLTDHTDDDQLPLKENYSIASCPCDASNVEFHIPVNIKNPFTDAIMHTIKINDNITLNGPVGSFVLDEESPNSLIFVAWNSGFAAIKSLIEHAMSLNHAPNIHFYWMTTKTENHYLDNLCRSWNDALDNFTYSPILCEEKTNIITDSFMQNLHNDHNHLLNIDLYIATPKQLNQHFKTLLTSQGIKEQNMHFENIFHEDNSNLD